MTSIERNPPTPRIGQAQIANAVTSAREWMRSAQARAPNQAAFLRAMQEQTLEELHAVMARDCTVPTFLQALAGGALFATLKNTAAAYTGMWGG